MGLLLFRVSHGEAPSGAVLCDAVLCDAGSRCLQGGLPPPYIGRRGPGPTHPGASPDRLSPQGVGSSHTLGEGAGRGGETWGGGALGRAFPQLSPVAGVGCGRGAARWGAARAWQIQRGPREGRAPKLPQKPWRRPAGQRSRWCRSTAPLLLGCSQDVRAWGGAPRKPAASLPVGSGAGCPRTWGLRHVPASTSFPSLPPPHPGDP